MWTTIFFDAFFFNFCRIGRVHQVEAHSYLLFLPSAGPDAGGTLRAMDAARWLVGGITLGSECLGNDFDGDGS
jgi:hypothetical protein